MKPYFDALLVVPTATMLSMDEGSVMKKFLPRVALSRIDKSKELEIKVPEPERSFMVEGTVYSIPVSYKQEQLNFLSPVSENLYIHYNKPHLTGFLDAFSITITEVLAGDEQKFFDTHLCRFIEATMRSGLKVMRDLHERGSGMRFDKSHNIVDTQGNPALLDDLVKAKACTLRHQTPLVVQYLEKKITEDDGLRNSYKLIESYIGYNFLHNSIAELGSFGAELYNLFISDNKGIYKEAFFFHKN